MRLLPRLLVIAAFVLWVENTKADVVQQIGPSGSSLAVTSQLAYEGGIFQRWRHSRYNDNTPYSESGSGQSNGSSKDFDFFLLALSWSPGFCATHASNIKTQCAQGSNLGFVVHGLWPQYIHGFLSNCARVPLPQAVLSEAKGLYPDAGLARYEWNKHGSCSGMDPRSYFGTVRRAREKITIPENFLKPNQNQSFDAMELKRALLSANPGLHPDMLALECRGGVLQEIRFCLSKDVREFQSCPEVARHSCRGQVNVPAIN